VGKVVQVKQVDCKYRAILDCGHMYYRSFVDPDKVKDFYECMTCQKKSLHVGHIVHRDYLRCT
jgi:hypothetical protein